MPPVRRAVTNTTLSLEAYRALRSSILNRRLPLGSKLLVRALAEEQGLSPTPIKEALAVLAKEGLVVAVPHRGYFIPRLSPQDIEEIYSLREVVEGLAARLAAERGTQQLVERLQNLLDRQK